jgi:hypothetical protein
VTDTYSPKDSALSMGQVTHTSAAQPAARPNGTWNPSSAPQNGVHELMSPEVNVQRIMWTGTIWFTAAVGAVAVALGLLLSSGWRPSVLPTADEALWWVGVALVTLSVGLIGWSGCPILEVDVPTADRNKSRTMQLGTMLFIVGGALSLLAVLLGPAS